LQDPLSNLLPYATVLENLHFAAEGARALGEAPALSHGDLVALLGLAPFAGRPVGSLSGGEQQLAALAAGAAAGGRLLLIDEPTSQLDPRERDRVAGALHDLHQASGATIVMVTHDAQLADTLPRTVTIRDGRVGAEGRHGTQYAVVARDGTIQLPPDVLEILPPDTLIRIVRRPEGIELLAPHLGEGAAP
ncbi:MAG TPA: AAA family ATPase, partial [Acidimicrobiales bacterium]|nr:AAA family ATPase [Acidimicrobiales bacterium]